MLASKVSVIVNLFCCLHLFSNPPSVPLPGPLPQYPSSSLTPPTLGLPLRFSLPNCRNQVNINSHGEGTQIEEATRRAHLSSPPELGGPSPFLDSFHF